MIRFFEMKSGSPSSYIFCMIALLSALGLGLLYLSYEPSPHESADGVQLWVDGAHVMTLNFTERASVDDMRSQLKDAFPRFNGVGKKLSVQQISYWSCFNLARVRPRLGEWLEPLINNDYWDVSDVTRSWFAGSADDSVIVDMTESELARLAVEPGAVYFSLAE